MSVLASLPSWAAQLPMAAQLEKLSKAVSHHRRAIVVAPPGSGKSLLVPLWALDELQGEKSEVWLLEPRRLAARSLARTLANILGEPLGETVGYKVRFDEIGCSRTQLWVITEGVFGRRVEEDPLLEGIGCVIIDEVHERSLQTDLALGFLKETGSARDDLRMLAMSATVDPSPFATFWNDCPVVEGCSRTFPVVVDYQDRADDRPLEASVCSAVASLLRRSDDDGGDVLVFLPGAPEIHRCLERLHKSELSGSPLLVPLYGALSAQEQDKALLPGGPRRVVLSTNIAQTSLTVPRVTTVVDSGLAKHAVFDPYTGLDRLVLGRIAKDAADQRAGRAGRTGPGRAIRLWTKAEHQGLAEQTTPQLRRADLSSVVLEVLALCPAGLSAFPFFEQPPAAAVQSALELLARLGAIDDKERVTPLGRQMLRMPTHPRLAATVLHASARNRAQAALCAAIIEQREILAQPENVTALAECDLAHRVCLLSRFADSRRTAKDAQALGLLPGPAAEAAHTADKLRGAPRGQPYACEDGTSAGPVLLPGFADRVCRRREPGSSEAVMVGGRAFRLSKDSNVSEAELFIALDADAGTRGERSTGTIRAASSICREDLARLGQGQLRVESVVRFDEKREAVTAENHLLFFDLVLDQRPTSRTDEGAMAKCLADEARRRFSSVFCPTPEAIALRQRIAFARLALPEEEFPDVTDETLGQWMNELCLGLRTFDEVRRIDWRRALLAKLTHAQRSLLDRELPERIAVPSGLLHPIDYEAATVSGTPVLAVKIQEMFGCAAPPRIAKGRVPLVLHLLAPNGRPAQVTSDLRAFWNGAYAIVRKELRGRYPKHPWPEDPWTALPTAKAKPRSQPK